MTTTTKDIVTATRDVATAVVKGGALDAVGAIQPAVLDMEKEWLKEALRQSLLLLQDGSWAM
eukprot:5244721-Prymnesium_polylepis.1